MSTLFIRSERGPRRSLQPGGGESKDLRLFFNELLSHDTCTVSVMLDCDAHHCRIAPFPHA